MAKPSYDQLARRVKELEKALGGLIDQAVQDEHDELFELSVVCNILQLLGSARDLDKLLSIVIDEVNKALLTEGAGVLLYDEHRGDLYWAEVKDARQILERQSSQLRLPLDRSIAGWVFRNNRPARVNDTSKDPRYYPGMASKSGFDIRKVLQVPLNTREKTIGVLMAMNKIGGDFTEQDEALLTSMAAGVALAIENATVYEKLKKFRDDLEMLYRSSMALGTTMDLDHLLVVVVAELNRAMDTEAAGVLLFDERRNDLYWREIQDDKGLLGRLAGDLHLPVEGSVSGRVFKTGEPVMLNDAKSDPQFFSEFETRSGLSIRNEILVPLNTREATIGVLVVINKKNGNFTSEDVQVCSSLASVVAMAVENAKFFDAMLASYRELENLNRVKSKIINHLSHELRTPLAIIRGSLATLEKKLQDQGVGGFEKALSRMNRQVISLNRLESQVESIMMTGYSWERRMITGFLDCALTLMEVQAERTPEIEHAAGVIHKWLAKTFPIRQDEPQRINIVQFSKPIFDYIRLMAEHESREVALDIDLNNSSHILITGQALQAVIEGLVRNAVEATPDGGKVTVTGRVNGGRYILKVKDTGVGIPDEAKGLIFEGFCPVQDTEDYSSGRPYSFNAGGKGIDLLRIRMFSELYGFRVSFTSERCRFVQDSTAELRGNSGQCAGCPEPEDCADNSGSEFVVDFPVMEEPAPEGDRQ
jgi:GAF domain-containing protein/uncharacterized protein YcfJ